MANLNKTKPQIHSWHIVQQVEEKNPLYRYRRLWAAIAVSSCVVSIVPLVFMVATNYYQYSKALAEQIQHPIKLQASNASHSIQFFLEERVLLLNFIIHDVEHSELRDKKTLTRIFKNLKANQSGFVDIGVIDSKGIQQSYIGPYGLHEKNYYNQGWFKETIFNGQHVSDVFMGYRNFPHFAIAVKREDNEGNPYVLRVTMNADILNKARQIDSIPSSRDSFVVNREGILQTPSRYFGKSLTRIPFLIPAKIEKTLIEENVDEDGSRQIVGYAAVAHSPFVYVVLEHRQTLFTSWFNLSNQLFWFAVGSIIVILFVIFAGSTYMVNRIREADDKRIALLHSVEYTAKMASIGRLAAGVAHEINNPLAIINEKAGLLKDIINYSPEFPKSEKFLKHIDPIINSVERCARITRRLLRFAKHIDIQAEPIRMGDLIKEVIGFLEKEASYRSLQIDLNVAPDIPVIESDRGRLEQVFLNIVNNAFGAVPDGGKIEVAIERHDMDQIRVAILDYGVGIPKENLNMIFEPFFTTKEKHGTGLGLSITYGIVTKLGGKITVESEEGAWTKFTVILPIKTPVKRGE